MRKLVHLIYGLVRYGVVRSGEPFRADFGQPALDGQTLSDPPIVGELELSM